MTSQRKRQQSLRQLPTISKSQNPAHQKKLSTIAQTSKPSTKDLTNIISKFTNNNNKEGLRYSEQLLRSAIAVLKGFSQTQNNFQPLFLDLYQVFKRFCFAVDDVEILTMLRMYQVKEGFSMRRTCIMLEKELDNVMADKTEKLKAITQELLSVTGKYEAARSQWTTDKNFLQKQILHYKKLADIDYMESLQKRLQSLSQTISEQQQQVARIQKQNNQFLKQIQHKDTQIHDNLYQISTLKSQLFDVRNRLDKTDIYFNQMRDRFDGLLLKMIGLKELIAKVEDQNGILVSQRMRLVNRAAVGFQELTPRPKYADLLGTKFGMGIGMSTNQIFKSLVDQQSQDNIKSIIQIMKEKRKNQRMQEAQAVRDKVVDDIILAKNKLDNLQKF